MPLVIEQQFITANLFEIFNIIQFPLLISDEGGRGVLQNESVEVVNDRI